MVCEVQEGSGDSLLQSGGVKGPSTSSALKETPKDWDVAIWETAGCDNMSQDPHVPLKGILGCKEYLVGQNY